MSAVITEQKKLDIAKRTLDFLQKEIAGEGYEGNDALIVQDEVLMLAYHASTNTDGLKRLFA